MNTAIINVRVDAEVKKDAQQIANELGLSLSALITASLKKLIRTKKISLRAEEIPNKRLIAVMKKAEADYKSGKASPTFDNAKDAIDFLEKHGI